jgi:hypothetical protein
VNGRNGADWPTQYPGWRRVANSQIAAAPDVKDTIRKNGNDCRKIVQLRPAVKGGIGLTFAERDEDRLAKGARIQRRA